MSLEVYFGSAAGMAQLSPWVLGVQDEPWDSSNFGKVSVAGSLLKPLASRLGFRNDQGDSGKQRVPQVVNE